MFPPRRRHTFPPARASRLASRLGGPARQVGRNGPQSGRMRQASDVQRYQGELEIQNKALRFSQSAAESAYERFVTLFSNVPLALLVVQEGGQIVDHNAQALALLRPQESDPELTYLLPRATPADQVRLAQCFAAAREGGTCELHELALQAGAQTTVLGDLHIARIDDAQDGTPQYICAIVDQGPQITQRLALQRSAETLHQRHQELLHSQHRLAAIIDASLDAIIAVDANQCISVFNPAATTLFGCAAERALGQPVARFLPEVGAALATCQSGPARPLGEMPGVCEDGRRVCLEVHLSCEQQGDDASATLFIHDLTARQRMQAQQAALEAQLRESQKMQAIGTMAGGIAHDFNNIIGAILGNVALARQDVDSDPASVNTSLGEIDKAGRRARDLVRQILTFSRNDPPHRRALQLADVVHETLKLAHVHLPPQITLKVSLDQDVPRVLADAVQIEQVLLNLLHNALDAIGARSGQIEISLAHWQAPQQAPQVRLQVSDDGAGMDPTTLERIFEPFFTTKPVGRGTGLGLSVVHGIVRAHAGDIQVKSTPGQGTVFTLFFPAQPTVTTTPWPAAAAPERNEGTGQRVLYVDDDEALVFLVQRALSRRGYRITTFSDPREAEQALRTDPQCCDVLVTDFNMPGYSGVDLLRTVHLIRADLPLALASGHITPEIESAARAAGASSLIYKPNDVDEFCKAVQQLLDDVGRQSAQ